MANAAYNRGKFRLIDYSWSTDVEDLGLLLVANTYTFDPDHDSVGDVEADETSGAGYGRRAITASARSASEDDTNNRALLIIADGTVTWSSISAGIDLRVILFFISGVDIDDSSNDLLGFVDSGTNIPIITTGADFALNFGTAGALRFVDP
jgi:hypothetical protein